MSREKKANQITLLPLRFGVFTHSDNSDNGPMPDRRLTATANSYILLNTISLLNEQLFDRPAIFSFTNDSRSICELR